MTQGSQSGAQHPCPLGSLDGDGLASAPFRLRRSPGTRFRRLQVTVHLAAASTSARTCCVFLGHQDISTCGLWSPAPTDRCQGRVLVRVEAAEQSLPPVHGLLSPSGLRGPGLPSSPLWLNWRPADPSAPLPCPSPGPPACHSLPLRCVWVLPCPGASLPRAQLGCRVRRVLGWAIREGSRKGCPCPECALRPTGQDHVLPACCKRSSAGPQRCPATVLWHEPVSLGTDTGLVCCPVL